MRKNNLIGCRFSRLTVAQNSHKRTVNGRITWICICDCGKTVVVAGYRLRGGYTKSCGCLSREKSSERMKIIRTNHSYLGKNCSQYKHGDSEERLYQIWHGMKTRCYNINSTKYKYYESINICPEWIDNYSAFKFWAILSGYANNLTIDRINVEDDYCPENCQWLPKGKHTAKTNRERKQRGTWNEEATPEYRR